MLHKAVETRGPGGWGGRSAPVALHDRSAEIPQAQPRACAVEQERDREENLRPPVLLLLLPAAAGRVVAGGVRRRVRGVAQNDSSTV